MAFGHELLFPILTTYGLEPSPADAVDLGNYCLAAGDQVCVLDFGGVNASEVFIFTLVAQIAGQSDYPTQAVVPSTSITFRNANPATMALVQAAWKKYRRILD